MNDKHNTKKKASKTFLTSKLCFSDHFASIKCQNKYLAKGFQGYIELNGTMENRFYWLRKITGEYLEEMINRYM